MLLIAADEPRGANPPVAAGGFRGLVDALPDRERGVGLEAVDDGLEQTFAVRRLRGACRGGRSVRSPSQSQPNSPCDPAASSFAFERDQPGAVS
jgi:hypothetical protein